MKVKWINHAGFLLESSGISLVCDPWLDGTAFDNGWKLLSPTAFTYEDFSQVTHIWFSHEHPDHFSPSNVKKIPPSVRAEITILYQTTADKKIIKFCRELGFKEVIELPPSQWFSLNTDVKVMNQNDKDGDSWLAIHAEDIRVLNLNDVVSYRTDAKLNQLNKLIGGVDLLFTQFSYASWVGNKTDFEFRKECAKERITAMDDQIRIFKPRYLIPFASFIWFCHEENYFINDLANRIGEVYKWLSDKKLHAIVMYPSDEWIVGQAYDSQKAIDRYNLDYQIMEQKPELMQGNTIDLDELKKMSGNYVQQLSKKNGRVIKWKLKNPVKIFLTDLKQAVHLTLDGLFESSDNYDDCDIAVSTGALAYCLKFDWGGGTLNINARFEKPPKGNFTHMENYFYIATLNNMGKRYSIFRILINGIRRLRERYSLYF